jgi:hypothetical protein
MKRHDVTFFVYFGSYEEEAIILDRALEAAAGAYCASILRSIPSTIYVVAFTGWPSVNLGLRRLLTVLLMRQPPAYHGLESQE